MAVLWATDVALTLAGQPAAYWSGNYAAAEEANFIFRPALTCGPTAFVAGAAASLAVQGAFVLMLRHPFGASLAIGVAAAHALGAAGWLLRLGTWGWPEATLFLAVAAEGASWCWRRAARNQLRQLTLLAKHAT